MTTPYTPPERLVERAQEAARELSARYVPRAGLSLAKLRDRFGAKNVIVVGTNKLEWHGEASRTLFFHPGMSVVRAKRLDEGQRDSMLEAASFVPGDSVLDCTAGLCSDSILFAYGGGPTSQITAIESEFPLYYVVSRGLREYEADSDAVTAAMRRVDIVFANHLFYLQAMPDRSVDIVYFDPMFRSPVHTSTGISPLRGFANEGRLHEEAVREAKRVARKTVLLKERRDGGEFERLGFSLPLRTLSPVTYGVIQC